VEGWPEGTDPECEEQDHGQVIIGGLYPEARTIMHEQRKVGGRDTASGASSQ
jgi:hypothetical protein